MLEHAATGLCNANQPSVSILGPMPAPVESIDIKPGVQRKEAGGRDKVIGVRPSNI